MLTRNDLAEYLPLLAKGALVTVEVFACALVVATLLGLVWALMRVSKVRALSGFSKVLINGIRGIPILVQLFYIYFVLPAFGINIPPFGAGVVGLTVNYAAYLSEVYRAGIQAVPRGQDHLCQVRPAALVLYRSISS